MTMVPVVVMAAGGVLALAAGLVLRRGTATLASATALVTGLGGLYAWASGAARVSVPWASTWGSELSLASDGLAALYVVLSCGIGAVVFAYSGAYLGGSLHHRLRFMAWMILFLGSMVLLALAQDLLVMFVAFDLTTLCSYQLIGHERAEREARSAAFTAVVVTGVTSALFLVGSVILARHSGSFDVRGTSGLEPDVSVTVATALIVVAALAKSAQVPLHFWLPRAMVAPTPVSAYLHSAAMVAAGVFVLARLHPLIELVPAFQPVLRGVGLVSLAVGGIGALFVDDMKRILAYSTIAQYGFMVVLLSMTAHVALVGFSLYVLAHGMAKSALFLCVGAVTKATGEEALSGVGGLAAKLPWLAAGSAAAAAGLAGLPLTMGFFKDELLFGASLEGAPWLPPVVVAGVALTFAYTVRLWTGIFLGRGTRTGTVSPALSLPVGVLGAVLLLGGVVVEPFERLAVAAGGAIARQGVSEEIAYHLDARAENIMALSAYAGGALLLLARLRWPGARRSLPRLRVSPGAAFDAALAAAGAASDAVHRFEVRDLRGRVAAILVPAAIVVGVGMAATAGDHRYEVGAVTEHLRLHVLLGLLMVAGLGAALARDHLAVVLGLGAVGYVAGGFFALSGAPEVALVSVLVGTALTLLWVAILPRLPAHPPPGEERPRARRLRPTVGIVAAGFAFPSVWATLSHEARRPVSEALIATTAQTNSTNVVTAILADFRGLDTLGEATVVAAAIVGIMALRQGGES